MLAYASYLLVSVLQVSLLAMATDLLAGHCGRLGLSAVFFAGIGGYTYATLSTQAGVAPVLAIVLTLFVGAVLAAAIGPLMVRMDREVFLLSSLGLVLVVESTAINLEVTRGPLGIASIPPIVDSADSAVGALLVLVPLTVLAVAGILLTLRYADSVRRACHAVRDDELAVTTTGLAPSHVLLVVFTIHGAIASLTGVGIVIAKTYVGPASFDIGLAITAVTVLVVGGVGARPYAALIAAVIITVAIEILAIVIQSPTLVGPSQRLLFNLALLVLLAFRQRGIMGPVIERRTNSSVRI